MFCPKCGVQLVSDASPFCTQCGAPVKASARAVVQAAGVAPLSVAVPRKRKTGKKLVVFGILGSVVVGALIVVESSQRTPSSDATTRQESRPVFPIVLDGRVGFIDATGTVVIEPQFESVNWEESFALDGLARFAIDQGDGKWKWGYLNGSGEVAIKARFDGAGPFKNGFAVVEAGGLGSVIDRNGKYVLEPKFSDVRGFSEGLAVVRIGGSCGYADSNGNIVVNPQYSEAYPFQDGLAIVVQGTGSAQRAGYIDKTGRVVIPLDYLWVQDFKEGLALVFSWALGFTDDHGNWSTGHAFIDKTGNQVIFLKASQAFGFKEGLALVNFGPMNQDDKAIWGYVDHDGQNVIKPQFKYAYSFNNGLAIAATSSVSYGFIDKTGKWVIEPSFTGLTDFSEELAGAKGAKWGFIDHTGSWKISPTFDEVWMFRNGLAMVRLGGTRGYVNKTGKYVWLPK